MSTVYCSYWGNGYIFAIPNEFIYINIYFFLIDCFGPNFVYIAIDFFSNTVNT